MNDEGSATSGEMTDPSTSGDRGQLGQDAAHIFETRTHIIVSQGDIASLGCLSGSC
jgi:hypothetical protein